MSIVLPSSAKLATKLENDLDIEIVENKNTKYAYTRIYRPYRTSKQQVIVPISYACKELKASRRKRAEFPQITCTFNGELRPHQADVKPEILNTLSKHGSCILNAYCAFGKCLGYNTPVMKANGSIVPVQDIRVGDQLMGDDSQPRNVLSLARGQEQMYRITPENGDSFTANESHILSLKTTSFEIRDIEIREYLALPALIRESLMLYKVALYFPTQSVSVNPYIFGRRLLVDKKYDSIPEIYKYNDNTTRLSFLRGIIDSQLESVSEDIYVYVENKRLVDDIVFLVRSVGMTAESFQSDGGGGFYVRIVQVNCLMMTNFTIEPIDDVDYYGFTIDGNRRFLLGDFTVTHNTAMSINIACTIGMPTLIVTPPTITLMKQWKKSIEDFSPSAVVEIIDGKSELVDADFYIVSAANIEKKGHSFFSNVGFAIVDELHKVMAERYSQGLWYIHPRYLLGLSATPYRLDELDNVIKMYFTWAGPQCMIVREQTRTFMVNCVHTYIRPTVKMNPTTGRIDWSSMVEWQATNVGRNKMIVSIVSEYEDRRFLILVKLTSQADMLTAFFEDIGISVASLIGKKQEYDRSTRVLIGTIGKIGTGFDDTELDGLILGTSVKNYFRQYLGRVFRRPDVEPVVFDLVDNHPILNKHFASRREEYIGLGGHIENFDVE